MTFAQPFDLRAGLPSSYLAVTGFVTLSLQLFLLLSWLQGKLDIVWLGLSLALTILFMLMTYLSNRRQKNYNLHWRAQPATYTLYSKPGERHQIASLKCYSIQTGKLVFVSFDLADARVKHLVFHQALNDKNAFRRFKVCLCWSSSEPE